MADSKPALHPSRFHLAEQQRRVFDIDVDIGITPQDMLNPAYWAHIAQQCRAKDRIEAMAEDGSWIAEFVVLDTGANWVKVHLLAGSYEKLQALEPESRPTILQGHSVAWAGRHALWRVVRDVDQKVLKDHLSSKDDAFTWLANYSRSVAA